MKSGRSLTDFQFLMKLDKGKGVKVGNISIENKD